MTPADLRKMIEDATPGVWRPAFYQSGVDALDALNDAAKDLK